MNRWPDKIEDWVINSNRCEAADLTGQRWRRPDTQSQTSANIFPGPVLLLGETHSGGGWIWSADRYWGIENAGLRGACCSGGLPGSFTQTFHPAPCAYSL